MTHLQSQFLKCNKLKSLQMTILNYSKTFTIHQVSLQPNRLMILLILLECLQVRVGATKHQLHMVGECLWTQEAIWAATPCKVWEVKCQIQWVVWEDLWEVCQWGEEWTQWCLQQEEAMECSLNLECMVECRSKITTQAMEGSQREECKEDLE